MRPSMKDIMIIIIIISDLSKTGFHQKPSGLHKGASQITKTDLQLRIIAVTTKHTKQNKYT